MTDVIPETPGDEEILVARVCPIPEVADNLISSDGVRFATLAIPATCAL